MCGIIGSIVNISETKLNIDFVKKNLTNLSHRGPDDKRMWISDDEKICLGHTRLSIIDLSNKNSQPFIDKNNKLVLIYNGEIYNYLELRNELSKKGHKFNTDGDTEVLLKSYVEWGLDLFQKIDGMFSFCILDQKKDKIYLARDIAGQKPLYYSFNQNCLNFSSELNCFYNQDLNYYSINEYLNCGFNLNSKSLLMNVSQVKPAHYISFDIKKFSFTENRYFSFQQDENINENIYEKFSRILSSSVSKQLRSDVSIGLLLSGGLDSSLITTFAIKERPNIKIYSVSFPDDPEYDELEYSKFIVDSFQLNHKVLKIDKVKPTDVHEILKKVDTPIFDSSFIPTYLLSKEVKKFSTVAIGGDGADELFGGYQYFSYLKILNYFKYFLPKKILIKILNNLLENKHNFKGRQYILNLLSDVNQIPLRFDDYLRKNLFKNKEIFKNVNLVKENLFKDNLTYQSFQNYLSENILLKLDRSSMLNSLELRSPYLSRDIINFAFFNLKEKDKYSFFKRKIFLKKFATKYLPENFNFQRKKGFSFPLCNYLNNKNWIDFFHDILTSKDCLFDKNYIENLLIHQKKGYDNSENLYGLLSFEIWRLKVQEWKLSINKN